MLINRIADHEYMEAVEECFLNTPNYNGRSELQKRIHAQSIIEEHFQCRQPEARWEMPEDAKSPHLVDFVHPMYSNTEAKFYNGPYYDNKTGTWRRSISVTFSAVPGWHELQSEHVDFVLLYRWLKLPDDRLITEGDELSYELTHAVPFSELGKYLKESKYNSSKYIIPGNLPKKWEV